MKRTILLLLIIVLGGLTFPGCRLEDSSALLQAAQRPASVSVVQKTTGTPATRLHPDSHRDLEAFFTNHDYDWKTLGKGVPPFIIDTLPADLQKVRSIDRRKRIFFLSVLPMVLLANEEIRDQRLTLKQLFAVYDREGSLSPEQHMTLQSIRKAYEVKGDPLKNRRVRRELLKRVDVIPASLALAQAATESAYGTSRFARRANNLFGEWTFIPGNGLVPRDRPEGASYEVRRFDSVYDSLKSYMNNINTHPAYRAFRAERAALRAQGRPLRGVALADGLERYSTRRQEYVRDLRSIIRHNRLSSLADASLRNSRPAGRSSAPRSGLLTSGTLSSRRLQLSEDGTTAD